MSVFSCVGTKGNINYVGSFFVSQSSYGHSLVSPGKPVLWCILAQLQSSAGTFLGSAMSAGTCLVSLQVDHMHFTAANCHAVSDSFLV